MKHWNRWLFAFCLFASLVFLPALAKAAPGVNTLTTSGTWNVGSNWSSGSVPVLSGSAFIDNGQTAYMVADVSGTVGTLMVGQTGAGTLSITGGSLRDNYTSIGNGASSNGLVTVTGGTWTSLISLVVGNSGTGTLTVEGSGVVNTGTLILAQNLGSVGTLNYNSGDLNVSSIAVGLGTATVNFNNFSDSEFATKLSGKINLTKKGPGTTVITGTTVYSGSTTISAGRLQVDGLLSGTSAVNVASGAVLSGSGRVNGMVAVSGTLAGTLTTGALSGSGLVSPGNSPGILTSVSADISTGMDFAFEFTLANTAPLYGNTEASGNDIQRFTSSTPFVGGPFTLANTISIYLSSSSVGTTYEGGFFTSLTAAELEAVIAGADFRFYVKDGDGTINNAGDVLFNGTYYAVLNASQLVEVSAIEVTDAVFTTGTASGSTLVFALVPEPGTWAMLVSGLGLLALGKRLRRRVA